MAALGAGCNIAPFAAEYLPRVEAADMAHCKRVHTDVLGTLPHVNAITSCSPGTITRNSDHDAPVTPEACFRHDGCGPMARYD